MTDTGLNANIVYTTTSVGPGNLAYTSPASGQIKLTWTASTDDTGVTGYDVGTDGTYIHFADGAAEAVARADLMLGARAFVKKPVRPESVLDALKECGVL